MFIPFATAVAPSLLALARTMSNGLLLGLTCYHHAPSYPLFRQECSLPLINSSTLALENPPTLPSLISENTQPQPHAVTTLSPSYPLNTSVPRLHTKPVPSAQPTQLPPLHLPFTVLFKDCLLWDTALTFSGCHWLLTAQHPAPCTYLKGVKVKLLSRVRLFCDPMDCSLPGPSIHGILQARVLAWFASSLSRGSSDPGTERTSPALAGGFFTV